MSGPDTSPKPASTTPWRERLIDPERKLLTFNSEYHEHYHESSEIHSLRMLVGRLATILDEYEGQLRHQARTIAVQNRHLLRRQRQASELADAKAQAYAERNQLLAALAMHASRLGWTAWRGKHAGAGWDDDWRNVIYIYRPDAGQMSWHIHDSELHLFAFLPLMIGEGARWDGHTTTETYQRLLTPPAEPRPNRFLGIIGRRGG